MSSTALYKAFIEVGASEDSATSAAEDVIQVSQLDQLATKTDIADVRTEIALLRNDMTSQISGVNSKIDSLRNDMTSEVGSLRNDMTSEVGSLRNDMMSKIGSLRSDMADRESRLVQWMVGSLFVFATIIIAGVGILFQVLLSPGVVQ